jgi:propanediol dehydratase small subunit
VNFTREDYPLAERHPDKVIGKHSKTLSDITLDAVISGDVTIEDLRITPAALHAQANVAHSAGRPRLGENFERASELVDVPQDVVMQVYELLRPGRAADKGQLLATAKMLRDTYKAVRIANFVEEAAEVYEVRGLFGKRF